MNEKDTRKTEFTSVSIPVPLFEKAKKQIEGTGFTSVSSYVGYILREVIAERGERPFTDDSDEKIREKLRKLGYLE